VVDVTTPNASGRIDERVREAGGRVERVRLGALHEGIAAVRAESAPATTPASSSPRSRGSTFTSASVSGSTASHRRP